MKVGKLNKIKLENTMATVRFLAEKKSNKDVLG